MKKILLTVVLVVLIMSLFASVAFAADGADTNAGLQINTTEIIIAVLGLFFTSILIPLIKAGAKWLKEKTKNEDIRAAISELESIATSVVAKLNATLVYDLKLATEDGELTKEDISAISKKSIEMVKSDLSKKAYDFLLKNADDFQSRVENVIEEKLLELKSSSGKVMNERLNAARKRSNTQ